jgi:hypothetical protein
MNTMRAERLERLEALARELRSGIAALQLQDVEQIEAMLRAQGCAVTAIGDLVGQYAALNREEREAVLKIKYLNSVYRKLLQHSQARLTIAVALRNSGRSAFNQAQPQSCDFRA